VNLVFQPIGCAAPTFCAGYVHYDQVDLMNSMVWSYFSTVVEGNGMQQSHFLSITGIVTVLSVVYML